MTEGSDMSIDDNGIEKINLDKVDWRGSREFFESLGETLDRLDDKDESYDFTWVGKRKAVIEAGAPINKTLRPDVDASKNWDSTENLFIEGDNLDALKLLQESYLGKVKMIYIDPPYNTGKDFVYHDNFKADVEQYDEDTEYKDDDGNIQFKKNEKTNGRYHSDWLSMMYPRLKLARNLLSDDGVIFISIDDNEQANLKKLCDEVFGEDNFVANIVWQNKEGGGGSDSKLFKVKHEYLLAYARGIDNTTVIGEAVDNESRYTETDDYESTRGKHLLIRLESASLGYIASLDYPITTPEGVVINPNTDGRKVKRWRWSKQKTEWGIKNNYVVFKKGGDGEWAVYTKQYLNADNSGNIVERRKVPLAVVDSWSTTQSAKELVKLFDGKKYFDYPKPIEYVKWLTSKIADENDLILDFFSGSATTAHAVMQLNAEDGGNRKWIMVQLPEETDEKSEAFKAGYKTIPEISRERIRRAGDKIAGEHPDAKVDYGFRALRIDDTNMKDVYRPATDVQQSMLDDLVDNVREDRNDLDLLFGVLTQAALELNRPLETVQLDGTTVYKYDYFGEVSGLVACFAPEISEATIKSIAAMRPLTVIPRSLIPRQPSQGESS